MEKEYTTLLNDILGGVKVRSFVFGKTSDVVYNYIQRRKPEVYDFRKKAYENGIRLGNEKNLELASRLFRIEVEHTERVFKNCR